MIELLIDLHKDRQRQGPGSRDSTLLALQMTGLSYSSNLTIGDFGCGTGASTLELAKKLQGTVHAVDFLEPFLNELEERAIEQQVAEKIITHNCSMDDLPFQQQVFDLIWSEGAVYNIGFKKGISAWKKYLKPGGKLVVSEITWLTTQRPIEVEEFWTREYGEMATASEKMNQLEQAGYSLLGYFPLSEDCWLTNYYEPLEKTYPGFLERQNYSSLAQALVEADKAEISLYKTYKAYYSYGIYVAQRVE
jgi:ubiquinone/menaquinone biosynthesis C-methylase UbiE